MINYVSFIGESVDDKQLLGGKGFYLDQMTKAGLPVPEGFTVTTEGYREWVKNEKQLSSDLEQQIREAVKELEKRTTRCLGKRDAPLLVSVRSGAPVSMPGMMDTVLNVGATDESIAGLAEQNNDGSSPHFAYQTYRDFMQQYMGIIHNKKNIAMNELAQKVFCPAFLSHSFGEQFLHNLFVRKTEGQSLKEILTGSYSLLIKNVVSSMFMENISIRGIRVSEDSTKYRTGKIALVTEEYLKILWDDDGFEEVPYTVIGPEKGKRAISSYPQLYAEAEQYVAERESVGQFIPDTLRLRRHLSDIPFDPLQQILACTDAVFASWNGNKAQAYREANNIPETLGTAVTIQRMVFGNIGPQSGTAVCFSSCPKTGEKKLSGEYLIGFQGERLVSGQKTPRDITTLREYQPRVYETLERLASKLEEQHSTVQDIEATWENREKVYVLQTRDAILTPSGKVGFALRQYQKGLLKEREVIMQLELQDIEALANNVSIEAHDIHPLTKGKSIIDGIVIGKLALTKDEVCALEGEPIVYCRQYTTPEDIAEIRKSAALLTIEGGRYSHAAVVAQGMNKVVLVGCEGMRIQDGSVVFDGEGEEVGSFRAGSVLTVDGYNGAVYANKQKICHGRASPALAEITRIARSIVAHLPAVYYAQHPDDLKNIPDDESTQLIYSIDFALLQGSGALENSLPQKGLETGLEESGYREAPHVYDVLQKCVPDSKIVLVYECLFDELYKSSARDPSLMQYTFLEKIAANTANTANATNAQTNETKIVYVSKDNSKLEKSFGNGFIHFYDELPFKTGQNCVLIKPWAVDESYFIAAREVLRCQA